MIAASWLLGAAWAAMAAIELFGIGTGIVESLCGKFKENK